MTRGKQPPALEQRVLSFIQQHRLIPNQQKILIAVSGGADSVCLLHILADLKDELGIKLHIAHLNHQLRASESEADAAYVTDLAHQLNIPITVENRDVKAHQAQKHISLEEAAREVRYTFLAQVGQSIGAERVAVGHTTDDHIETILMHLIRGTGTKGLRGLQPGAVWHSAETVITVIRPLLEISRAETEDYCYHHQIKPRIDTSNLSLSPLRNRIRHQLLPLLRSYNPKITTALLRTARIAADELAILDNEVSRIWNKIAKEQENAIIIDKEQIMELPPALKRHLFRISIEKLLGNLMDIETRHIEAIMNFLTKPAGKKINLPGGLIFSTDYGKYLLSSDPSGLSPFPTIETEYPLEIPGETLLPGWYIKATITPPQARKDDAGAYKAYLNLDKTGSKAIVRPRRRGDRFQPLGMSQPKKLGEFMIDARIPSAWRQQVPIVCSPQHILWVVGWRIDERAKVTANTGQILCLEFKRR